MRSFASRLNIGLVRSSNQDQVLVAHKNQTSLLLVCDGMGGAKAGEVASALALKHFKAAFDGSKLKAEHYQEWLNQNVHEANQMILEAADQNPNYQGMGTTLVAALISKDTMVIANVGDSRAYVLINDHLHQVSEDHSLVNDLIKQNKITALEAKSHPQRSVLTQVLGVVQDFKVDFYTLSQAPQALLLCSDGLHGMLSDDEILDILRTYESADKTAKVLEQRALDKGAFDNIAIALMRQKV
jgi:serine/threonine protein phosphatase PrpC